MIRFLTIAVIIQDESGLLCFSSSPLGSRLLNPSLFAPTVRLRLFSLLCVLVLAFVGFETHAVAAPPAIGDKAADFTLKSIDGEDVALAAVLRQGPTVLIVLRGYPGYQCPLCTRQVADFLKHADEIKARRGQVLMIYPGPAANLRARAQEFIRGKTLPENFTLLVDPAYAFVNAYGLRWDAPNETAYPSTFVIDQNSKVRFARISKSHGDRARAADIVKALSQ